MNSLPWIVNEIKFKLKNLPPTSQDAKWKLFYKMELSQIRNRFYNPDFQFLRERAEIFHDSFVEFCMYSKIQPECFALAISLFDSVLSRTTIEISNIFDFALASLFLSIKVRGSKLSRKLAKKFSNMFWNINWRLIARIERYILINFDSSI